MNSLLSLDRQRSLLAQLAELSTARQQAEEAIARNWEEAKTGAEATFAQAVADHDAQYAQDKSQLEQGWQDKKASALSKYERAMSDAQHEHDTAVGDAEEQHSTIKESATATCNEAKWEANAVFDAKQNRPTEQLLEFEQRLTDNGRALQDIRQKQTQVLLACDVSISSSAHDEPPEVPEWPHSFNYLKQAVLEAQEHLENLSDHVRGRWAKFFRTVFMFIAAGAVCTFSAGLVYEFEGWHWMAWGGAGFLVLGFAGNLLLNWFDRWQVRRDYAPLAEALAHGDAAYERCQVQLQQVREKQLAEIQRTHEAEIHRLESKLANTLVSAQAERDEVVTQAREKLEQSLEEITAERDQNVANLDDVYPVRLSTLELDYRRRQEELEAQHQEQLAAADSVHQADWQEMAEAWQQGMANLLTQIERINHFADECFPDFSQTEWSNWQGPTDIPPAIRIGQYEVRLNELPGGLPDKPELREGIPESITLPACVPFPTRPSLVLKVSGRQRGDAVSALQTVMLRTLTSLPPGKVRFTIVDAVGLGENFAGFMHLADYDEALVGSRIWTEAEHVEQRLTDLTEHMENVIQTYLRNEFETIDQYNRHAGEVAEPFRVLVVANFPAGFTEAAMARLRSIVHSGPRCGVYTLMSADVRQKLPQTFRMSDVEDAGTVVRWRDEGVTWNVPELDLFPLTLDSPPPADRFTEIVCTVGQQAKDAGKVEVPFHYLLPKNGWWEGDSARGVEAPLGRAGATRLQNLALGSGTSQHVLVAGKTGSGKSTLWHVLILSLAVRYKPSELQLYLIDFKKGVEFKTYATHHLPHARVVAVESEREFGLSVLQKLDQELRERGDAFRRLEVQDVAGYRQVAGKLPRILLIVDEFQELFVEDDRVAHQAALLLDRLVRQGRAFGIHVLLGSQTLGGAYSLARSTIGQMAVRIAMQCSEADAHMILNEGNSAARLLSRPGEAIYNDANGMMEGNRPFQTAWLATEQRDSTLAQLQRMAQEQELVGSEPMIVFEGNVPAQLAKNHLLRELQAQPHWPDTPLVSNIYLGDPVAIKDPTQIVLRRLAGNNAMIVGQRQQSALAMCAAGMLSLALEHPPATDDTHCPTLFVLDGSSSDAPNAGLLRRMTEKVPHAAQYGSWRETGSMVNTIFEELVRRDEAGITDAPPVFLFVFDAARCRDLKRDEFDYGMSSFGSDEPETPSASKQFNRILREGPGVGIHTVLWCDTATAFFRMFERQTLREFEYRVLFQMSGEDSSNLIDTPVAGQLGAERALLYSEQLGEYEKFLPYDLPERAWMDDLLNQLSQRESNTARETTSDQSPI